ncbi:hypothetical protein F66182_631 [Fusarium sp. NRRL 66182]|nr:hypothetical protein F66182_631 [Fusarium sp. NRRL 66182]
MAATEQNGIDILCDAAGSDMLLSSLFSLATPVSDPHQRVQPPLQQQELLSPSSPSKQSAQHHIFQQQQQQQLDPAPQQRQGEPSPGISSAVPSKRKLSDASASSPSHVCHICRRVYERADHLTRHLRSHENARPYQCSRCPKRFNRADLLTRHETTHDRDGAAKDRPFIRRSDRAAEACLNCAASKAKCEDQKPCSRCRSKSLTCQMPVRRGNQYRTSESQAGMSPSGSSMVASTAGNDSHIFAAGEAAFAFSQPAMVNQGHAIDASVDYASTSFLGAPSVEDTPEELLYFTTTQRIFSDFEFFWDTDFGLFKIPGSDVNGPNPQPGNGAKRSSRRARKEIAQEDLALWHSEMSNQAGGLGLCSDLVSCCARDSLFAMVLAHNPTPHRVPTFPSAELLSCLVEIYFIGEDVKNDAFVHKASFDTSTAGPELLSAIASNGAAYISSPAIWQFGLALGEVTGGVIGKRLESPSAAFRDMTLLQASLLHLETGQWSGFNRQTEMAEAFAPQLLTVLRKTGRMGFTLDANLIMADTDDASDILDSKWRNFVALESCKRLAIRAFLYDVQSSILLWKSSTLAYSELKFALPAACDLWKASSSQAWGDLHLSKGPMPASGIPRLSDARDCGLFMTEPNGWIDAETCCMVALHGLWGQIWTYRDAVTHCHDGAGRHESEVPTWAQALYQELYSSLRKLSNHFQGTQILRPELSILSELFMMILHVSLDDVQRLAGRKGEEESRRAVQSLENAWFPRSESRYAIWHAGQVLRYAENCKSASLQGFNAMAVYFACLTLWAYGLISQRSANGHQGMGHDLVSLNVPETRESTAFVELGQGTPSLSSREGLQLQLEPVSNHTATLSLARFIFRQNYPTTNGLMPPLVEGLCRHLVDLQSRADGRTVVNTAQKV